MPESTPQTSQTPDATRDVAGASAHTLDSSMRRSANRWSWGAFILDPFFILAIRKYKFLFVYLLYFVPLLNFFIMLIVKIYLGLNAHSMVAQSAAFDNDDERRGFMKAIDHAGLITFLFFLVMFSVSFLLVIVGIMLLGQTVEPAVTPADVPDVIPVP